ncbi:MAG: DNA methylase [Clostridiales bacterium]|nr:DNA methylase [Clostridiales bacterium]
MEQTSERTYICIDLKSFYASVECVARGLDPLGVNLVVADETRTEKTICLAVSPSLKAYGISGRARLFEVVQRVAELNSDRRYAARGRKLTGSSWVDAELKADKSLAIDYIVAPPRMAKYMAVSTQIYNIYLRYIAPEDIHVYSVDEVFIDATNYGRLYRMTPRELAMKMIGDVLNETGITATVGIGTNMYLAKIAMDIDAKHMKPDENGVRISELDEMSYRRRLWSHTPITDFWRIGKGIARRLDEYGIRTMGDIALCSVADKRSALNEDFLYKLFGINAELLIDHAWGYEPCTMADVKAYRPRTHSLSLGQVLKEPYEFERARLIVREMADDLSMDVFAKGLVTDQVVLTVCYDTENVRDPERRRRYKGPIEADGYGRQAPKSAHGSFNLPMTSSTKLFTEGAVALFDRIADRSLTVRRIYVVANHTVPKEALPSGPVYEQLDLFTDPEEQKRAFERERFAREREERRQDALVKIRGKFGKNAILKGMNYEEGATSIERNGQIGGHRAGDPEQGGQTPGGVKKNSTGGTTCPCEYEEDGMRRGEDAYEEIIGLPHHKSAERPHMSNYDRAAQFAPFAALTGYEEAVSETARLTEQKPELDEDEKQLIDAWLRRLRQDPGSVDAGVTYFTADKRKKGGAILESKAAVAGIDEHARAVVFEDGTSVPIDDIIAVDGE